MGRSSPPQKKIHMLVNVGVVILTYAEGIRVGLFAINNAMSALILIATRTQKLLSFQTVIQYVSSIINTISHTYNT